MGEDFDPNTDELVGRNADFAADFSDADLQVAPTRRLAVVACMDSRMDIFKMINNGSPAESDGNNGTKMQPKGGASLSPVQVAEITAFLITKLPEEFKDIPAKE